MASCNSCLHRCMDMDMDPYCACPAVTDKHPYGLVLHRGAPSECLKEGVYTQYEKDTRGNQNASK